MNQKSKLFRGLLALHAVSAVPLLGQVDAAEDEVIILDQVEAESVPIEESILATTRPITSVYGTDRSILDTPRNVNIISREQLDAISIKDVRDFSKLTSSSYTKTNFGAPTTPNLRGQEADLFINGMRRGMSVNGNGVPINFNSVESVNIVKGPAGAIFGTSNYVGGYADLVTKRAYFQQGGEIKYSYNTLDQHTVDVDVNTPINDKLAARVSVQLKDWEGFHERWYQESQSVYGTFVYRPNDQYRLDVMGEFYNGNYTENWGINRVTQDLIDNGRYLPNNQSDAEYFRHIQNLGNGVGFFVPGARLPGPGVANPTQASVFGGGGFATISPIDPNNTVPVNRKWKLAAPGDDSNAKVFWMQAIQEYVSSDNLKFLNNTYFHYKDRDTFSSYHYSELQRDNWSIENRFQIIQEIADLDKIESLTFNYGARVKYQDIWAVNHFTNEPVNFWDLSRGTAANNFRVPDQAFAGNYFVRDQDPRGALSRWYVDQNSSDAVDSQTWIIGPFVQTDIELTDRFSVLLGYTVDFVEHKEAFPSEVIPQPGNPAAPPGFYDSRKESAALQNYNGSVIFKPTPKTSVYATVNFGEHYLASNGGAVDGTSLIEPSQTELYEVGLNASLIEDKLYLGIAAFRQKYEERDQFGGVTPIETDGIEIELNYQPNRNLFATLGYSWLDSKRKAGFFASPYTADRANETNGFYISPTFGVDGDAWFENPGVPEHLLNGLVQYKFGNGLGVQANIQLWGEMNAGYGGYVTAIPSESAAFGSPYVLVANTPRFDIQFEVDAKIFYEHKGWRFEFSVFNVTDEENWDTNNSGYGNGSVVARAERNYEFSAAYKW